MDDTTPPVARSGPASGLPEALAEELDTLATISRNLRRDRDLAFYGAEDLTPSGFYSREDGEQARSGARWTVNLVKSHVLPSG